MSDFEKEQQELTGKVRSLRLLKNTGSGEQRPDPVRKPKHISKQPIRPRYSLCEPVNIGDPMDRASKQRTKNECRLGRVDSSFLRTIREINSECGQKTDEKASVSENTKESLHIKEANQIDSTLNLDPTTHAKTYAEARQLSCQLDLNKERDPGTSMKLISYDDFW